MIEVHLFGNLRRHAADPTPTRDTVVHLAGGENNTVGQVLAQVGIDPAEVGNVFLNGRLVPRSGYPILLGYPLAADRPLLQDAYLDVVVAPGDRVGVFPRNMSSVVV